MIDACKLYQLIASLRFVGVALRKMPGFGRLFSSRNSSKDRSTNSRTENVSSSNDFYDDTHLGYGVESRARPIIEEPPDENEAQSSAGVDAWDYPGHHHRDLLNRDALSIWGGDSFSDPFSMMRSMMTEMDSVFRNLDSHFGAFSTFDSVLADTSEHSFAQSTRTIRRTRPDGSVYEETVTTRRAPDGTVEETRTVRDSSTGENRTIANRGFEARALESKPGQGPRIEECPDGEEL
jgi:hypothetical protein